MSIHQKLVYESHHNTYEEWLYVNADGTVEYHHELDGWAAKKGINATCETLTSDAAKRRWPKHAKAIDEALAELIG